VIRCGLTDTMMANVPVSLVFFYDRVLDEELLADSLAAALALVPAFAGRLRPGERGLEIVCDDSGVPMTSFDIPETLAQAMGRVTLPGSGLVAHVDAAAARSGELPLLTARVCRLADGGMTLGCSWHHAIGDLRSFMLLMRAWSAAAGGGEQAEPAILVGDRDAYLDQVLPATDSGRAGIRLPDADESAGRQRELEAAVLSGRVVQAYFADAEVARMRAAFTEAAGAAGQRLSANDALCGHLVATIRQLDEDTEARRLAVAVDIRPRLGLPLTVVGNLTNEIYLTCAPAKAPEAIAGQIRSAIAAFASDHLSIRSSHALLARIGPGRLADCVPVGFDLRNKTLTFNSWSRFGLYDTVLCGQRPVFFSPSPSVAVPWTSWLVEGCGGSGYLYTLVLPGKLAGRLRGAGGRAALHRFRAESDELPPLAATARKLL
jgi:hypothetical protein